MLVVKMGSRNLRTASRQLGSYAHISKIPGYATRSHSDDNNTDESVSCEKNKNLKEN